MGKGKKKGGKGKDEEPEVPSMSSLSLSDAPSTSQSGAQAEEEASGLTSAAAKRKAKKAAKAAPLEGSKPRSVPVTSISEPEPEAPKPAPEPVKPVEEDKAKSEEKEEEGGLGLGMEGKTKKKPRKKKPSLASQEAAVPAGEIAAGTPAPAGQVAAVAPALPKQAAAFGPAAVGQAPAFRAAPQGQAVAFGPAPPAAGALSQPWPPAQAQAQAPWAGRGGGRGMPSGPPGGLPQAGPPAGRPGAPGAPPGYARQPGPPGPPGLAQPGPPGYVQQPVPPGYVQQPPGLPGFKQPLPPGFGQARPPPQQQVPPQQPQSARQTTPPAAPGPQGDRPGSASKTVCRYKIPLKIEGNSVPCRPIKVLTNYLEMKIAPLKIHRYDVTYKPDKPKKMISPVFVAIKKKHFPRELIAFDQMKNCYCLKPLPKVSDTDRYAINEEYIDGNGKKIPVEVSFKFTGIVDLSTIITYMKSGGSSLNPPTEAIQCIDVILRQGTLESYIKAGRQFFKRPARPIDLGDGLEMWTGMFQSAIFTTRPFINVDVAHKGFPRAQPLVQALTNDFKLSTNEKVENQRSRGVDSFQAFVKGLKVVAYIGGDTSAGGQKREFIANGLTDSPSRLSFPMDIGGGKTKNVTVAEYFAKEKGYRLRYPNLNCVWVGPRDKNINYPMELLEVAYGQARNRQLNEIQLSTMVRQAATPPDERKRKIEEVIKDMDYSRNRDFKQFGLEISDKFFPVDAKVLAPPRLETGSGSVEPRNGSWQANRLLKPEALQNWGFIMIEPDQRSQLDPANIISLMMNCGRQMGMTVSEPSVKCFNLRMQELRNTLLKCLEEQVKFLFIIVPTRGRDYYHRVKQMAERDVGILTQCIKEQTASKRMNPQTARNILLKVNSKLMGINQALDNRSLPNCLKDGRVMVVGADVTHPSPDQTSVPSIAAVTASIDPKCFMYNIGLSIQTPKKEMIIEFEDMMVEHLTIYKQRNGFLPTKIYVFRDGVSEGQFAQVMNSELLAVHKAYQRMAGPTAKPEVLFLLVQKRHHTRLFTGENNPKNVEPGTVVDKHIVHATELDFYLVSHQAIKGTARPTRYHAVCNDGNLKHDEVEQLTYYLCHLYSRCMRSVSYPTPTYYAHLACLRARSLTYDERFDNARLEREPRRLRVLDKMLSYSRMFFV
ncbi:protein argonaute-2-like [Cydia splendana]|uniref:protein argonaute-2-like n=1 Tax=Cydia splendana TaxID=1100963 RepID=UPI0028F46810